MKQLIQQRFSDPAIEELLQTLFEHLPARVKLSAETFGKRNLPLPVGDQVTSYFDEFFLECQQTIDIVNSKLQFQTSCFEVSENDQSVIAESRPIDNDIRTAKEALIPIEQKIRNTVSPDNRHKILYTRLAILLLCVFDGTMTASVFTQWGYSFIESVVMGGLFAGFLCIFTHTVPHIIQLGKTKWQKRLIAISIFIAITVLFSFFAITRAQLISALLHEQNIAVQVSPWPFIIMSDFLFVTAVGVYVFFMPGKSEKEAIRQYDALIGQRDAINRKIELLHKKQCDLQYNRVALRLTNSSIVVYGNSTEKRIIHFARKEFAHWKNESLMHRSDHVIPDCYSHDFPFTFSLYFNSID